jgi:hypothetical protein
MKCQKAVSHNYSKLTDAMALSASSGGTIPLIGTVSYSLLVN